MVRDNSSKANIIPCSKTEEFTSLINEYSESLREAAYGIGNHGLTKDEFDESGLFDAAIERIRGQKAARTTDKYGFIIRILQLMKAEDVIKDWDSTGGDGRMDFRVYHLGGQQSAIEAKGCLDGNNTTIFERPSYADELIIWSLCQNTGSDPKKNAWSGLHTRLGVEMLSNPGKKVDAVIIWDDLCGTKGRVCPKSEKLDAVEKPPPCVYLFPSSQPTLENPFPESHRLEDVFFVNALRNLFGFGLNNVFNIRFMVSMEGGDLKRQTYLYRLPRDGGDRYAFEPSAVSRIKR